MNRIPSTRLLVLAASLALAAPGFGQATTTTPATGSSSSAKPSSSLSSAEKKFVKDAGEAQISLLHLTELTRRPEQPGTEELKKFVGNLGKELNTAWGELGTIAQSKAVELPKTEMSASEKSAIEKLKKAKTDDFDKAFLKAFNKETKKAAQVFETGEKGLKDVELKSFAQKYGPTLKKANEEGETMEKEAGKKK